MKRPAAATAGGAAKQRRTQSAAQLTAEAAVAQVLQGIGHGQTRTKMEVFRAAMILMGRGSEGIDTGCRTVLGGKLRQLVAARASGWHRVVSSDGDLWEGKAAAEQLCKLRAEGSRPREGESVSSWAKRVRASLVGCYKASKGRPCSSASEPDIDLWPPLAVEPLGSKKSLQERVRLSGGKHFHLPGEERPTPPAFHCSPKRKAHILSAKQALGCISPRISSAFSPKAMQELSSRGAVCFRRLLHPEECAGLLHYAVAADFQDVTNLDGEAGQGGSYYFCREPPPLINALRHSLYARLVDLLPSLVPKFGSTLAALERKCHAAGQRRCASIFLTFGEGGINLAHKDPYGSLFFPYQAVVMLSRRGKDFSGGKFFVTNVKTGTTTEVAADEGDVTLFAANEAALRGADFKHGVREVRPAQGSKSSGTRCERFSVGVVFNLRK